MPIFPFFQYPYNINRYYPKNNIYSQKNDYIKPINHETNSNLNNSDGNDTSKNDELSSRQNKSSRYNSFGPIHFQNPFDMDSGEPIIEILGISLYLDDIIILGLLFFLYQEGVKDYMLYLVLIMLLLS